MLSLRISSEPPRTSSGRSSIGLDVSEQQGQVLGTERAEAALVVLDVVDAPDVRVEGAPTAERLGAVRTVHPAAVVVLALDVMEQDLLGRRGEAAVRTGAGARAVDGHVAAGHAQVRVEQLRRALAAGPARLQLLQRGPARRAARRRRHGKRN